MTDRIKEQLSAFLDGELPDTESALLLKRLERDDELRGALSRYSLVGAVLRSDGDVPAARQVAARVSAAIAKEPFRAAAFVRLPGREALLRGFAGLAVAAGVALGSVALLQEFRSQDAAAPSAVVARVEVPPVQPVMDDTEPAAVYTTPPATESAAGIAPAELANFLVAHYGFATPLVRRSVGAGLIGGDSAALRDGVPPAEQDGQ
jgi:sigma-E factor negative regulatory protein RseA